MTESAPLPQQSNSTDSSAQAPPARVAAPATAVSRGMRETIESIAIALALAFLFKTFEAEAFVIPTGSMAPTLMGRHKDVVCPKCGYRYSASGSDEADHNGNERQDPGQQVVACTCPICRFTMSVDPRDEQNQGRSANPSYSGDRIWVSKVPYHFSEPRRFDVIVFRYPLEAETYYIKRLVGLPSETVEILHGDLFAKAQGESDFSIVRKPPDKLLAMAQTVHDNDYVSRELLEHGWPTRWQSEPQAGAPGAWQASADTRSYRTDGAAKSDAWIRYRHTVPSEANWHHDRWPPQQPARPQLITDFYAFNIRVLRSESAYGPPANALGLHWVGDLVLDCRLDVQSEQGMALFELVKGGRHFGCSIDVASGRAELSIGGLSDWRPTAQTTIRGRGAHQVMFANVDRQLLLWVDGRLVQFDRPTTYDDLHNDAPQSGPGDPGDLAPLGIGSRGAALSVNHLRVLRDIYYIADTSIRGGGSVHDYDDFEGEVPKMSRAELADFYASPERWRNERGQSVFADRRGKTFPLEADQFFVLGDNSPASSDARLWPQHYVDRELLIGKALFIYWPHPLRLFVPFTDASLPLVPNVGSMGFIR